MPGLQRRHVSTLQLIAIASISVGAARAADKHGALEAPSGYGEAPVPQDHSAAIGPSNYGAAVAPSDDPTRSVVEVYGAPMAADANETAQERARSAKRVPPLRLVKEAQSTISTISSVTLSNTLGWAVGSRNQVQNQLTLDLQFPIHIGADWTIIVDPSLPVLAQPALQGAPAAFGLGDMTLSLQLSPTHTHLADWGAGVAFLFPTATNTDVLGTGNFAFSPKLTGSLAPGRWVLELAVSNLFSYAGRSAGVRVNELSIAVTVVYDLSGKSTGWLIGTESTIASDWEAPESRTWLVPVGGGVGRFFELWDEDFQVTNGIYYNVLNPAPAILAEWTWGLRLTWISEDSL